MGFVFLHFLMAVLPVIHLRMKGGDEVNVFLLAALSNPGIYPEVGIDPSVAEITGQKRSILRFSIEVLLRNSPFRKNPDLDVPTRACVIFPEQSLKELDGISYELLFVGDIRFLFPMTVFLPLA